MLGDINNPIRCSKLAAMVKCRMRIYLLDSINNEDDEGGPAAQNGSVTHAGIEAYHKNKGTLAERKKAAWDAIASASKKFPLADQNEVRLFITPYMDDPRNINAQFLVNGRGELCIEQEVTFTLQPHPLDPTGEPIHLLGHIDQIRLQQGQSKVWDYKSGKKTGWEMLHDYAIQLACYTYGASDIGLGTIHPGGIIRGHGYRTRNVESVSPDGVFWACPYTREDLLSVLEESTLAVALYRMGEITYGPGPHCTYCEFGGLSGCISEFKKRTMSRKM